MIRSKFRIRDLKFDKLSCSSLSIFLLSFRPYFVAA